MNHLLYDIIEQYKLDLAEARAYQISLLWIKYSQKYFPNLRHNKLKSGDPRKSLLFKISYKLQRETIGILEEKDYSLYVQAQLDILRHINVNKTQPMIDANCLTGDRAWKRWKLWKKKYDAKYQTVKQASTTDGLPVKIQLALEKTKEFITKTFGKHPALEQYQNKTDLLKWINLGKISPYYLALSPYIAKTLTTDDFRKINFDLGVYQESLTEMVREYFKKLFPYEFVSL